MADWLSDADALAEQYADPGNLNARKALHEGYGTATVPFRTWQFDQFDLSGEANVLSLGCGPADLWTENADRVPAGWDVTVTDFSPGMVAAARRNIDDAKPDFRFAVLDASGLPFRAETVDAVTAHHMLYHVPDRDGAFRDIRRVLRPGGRLYAATNGHDNLSELREVLHSVHGGSLPEGSGFRLENGESQLREHFERVSIRRYDDALCVTDVEPLIAYALSRDEFDESDVSDLREAFESRFEDGVFEITKDVGMFVAERA